jgi:hypothetical protein
MNYEKIILELLDRIKTLEEKVAVLEKTEQVIPESEERKQKLPYMRKNTLTQQARDYITEKKEEAKKQGLKEITLLCNDIQIALGVTNRTPCICTAMYDCMTEGDVVVSAPPSGKSTTVLVKYSIK